jgi:hypothetical protein
LTNLPSFAAAGLVADVTLAQVDEALHALAAELVRAVAAGPRV